MWRVAGTCLLFSLCVLPNPVRGDEAAADVSLDTVTVLATRTIKSTQDVPRSVDVVKADAIDEREASDGLSLLDALPNVSLTGSPRTTGEQVQIRGLSGERVLMLVDGVRQPYSKGHLGNSLIDPELIQQVEVEKGPASVLWGSGALGGVVSVTTKTAADLLRSGERVGARLTGGYQSADDGWLTGATLYGRLHERLDGLLYVGHRDKQDVRLGNGDELPYSAYDDNTLLARLGWYLSDAQSLKLMHRSARLQGEQPSNPASNVSNENPLLDRHIATDNTSLEWRFAPADGSADMLARLTRAHVRVDEDAATLTRDDMTQVETLGLDLTNTNRFTLGGRHALTYGVDASRDEANGTRNGADRPEFPDAVRTLAGVFVQDEIHWGEKWITSLGVRHDNYHSESRKDVAPDQTQEHTSSQFGVVWQTTPWLSLYASYAEAFRAPTLEELYATGTHFGANHFIANPDLKPEQAANKEIGLRSHWQNVLAANDKLAFNLTAFRNDVKDFIDLIVDVQPAPPPFYVGGTTRSENVTDARLEGFEAGLDYSVSGWFLRLSYGQTRGDNRTDDQPLADVAPARWVLDMGKTKLFEKGQLLLRTTHVSRQDRVPTGVDETPGYTLLGLMGSWAVTPDIKLGLAVNNLTDRAYRSHNSVIDEVGRNISASLSWQL